jgi:predicted transcriptional regulator
MKPRAVGGAIGRADSIFVWVPYAEVVYEDEEEEQVEVVETEPASGVVLGEGEDEDEDDDEPEEVGYWLAVTKVQARELVAEACTSDIEDLEIEAEERPTGLYIGLGPLP